MVKLESQPPTPLAEVLIPTQHWRDAAGAAQVVQLQSKALSKLGFRLRLVLVNPRLNPLAAHLPKDAQALVYSARRGGFHDVVWSTEMHRLRHPRHYIRILAGRLRNRWTLEDDLAVSYLMRSPDTAEPASLTVANYLSTVSQNQGGDGLDKLIIVLHDLPKIGLGKEALEAIRRSGVVVMLSHQEAQHLQMLLPENNIQVGTPIPMVQPLTSKDVPKAATFAALLRACGLKEPSETFSNAPMTHIDLLFVGGAHPPNRESLLAFYNYCFVPFLLDEGVTMAVAGDAGRSLWGNRPPKGVAVLGRVPNLRPLYAAARLVIVPLMHGTGISIKTLEAIALTKPILASPAGLRGLDGVEAFALDPPFDRRWADRILSLLRDIHALDAKRLPLLRAAEMNTMASVLQNICGYWFGMRSAMPDAELPADMREILTPTSHWVAATDEP